MQRILNAFDALCANGRRQNRVNGFAPIAMRRNSSTAIAEQCGIRLKLAEDVQRALINGVGLRVCNAAVGRATKIGMKMKILKQTHSSPVCIFC